MEIHMWLANLAWVLLIAVMVVRPLCNITGWNILKKGMKYRQQIGIASGLAAICHVLVYVIINRLGLDFWLGPVWSLQTLLGWGMLALVCLLLPLLTSNHYSQKLLKNNWKNVQRLSYLFFIFTAIHISFIAGD
jgi:DMSO/TMAO reductase YedYZ heme-binding membrane subunit